jgi:hypothetical protein
MVLENSEGCEKFDQLVVVEGHTGSRSRWSVQRSILVISLNDYQTIRTEAVDEQLE